MEPLLDLPIDQFFGALDELGLDPERRADLLREYRRRNSAFSPVYGLLDSVADEDAAQGMRRADIVPISRPEGMSVFDAIRSGDWRLAVPQSALDTLGSVAGALDVPAAAAAGLIPREDMVGEALNAAGAVMGLGGLLARPAGSLGTGGRVAPDARASDWIDDLRSRYPGVRIDVSGGPGRGYTVSRIVVPEGERSQGLGTQIMREITDIADSQNATVALTPSSDFGGNVSRLRDFYGRLGFVRNRGRNRDMSISEEMYREPVSSNRSTTTGLLAAASAETPAQQVARLLREDPSQVTDDMLDALTPNDNVELARLYEEGATGMPMPMDEASRMARAAERGRVDDQFHATFDDFSVFMPSETGLTGRGVYTGDDAGDVLDYARSRRSSIEGLNVIPLLAPESSTYARRIDWQNTLDADPDLPYNATWEQNVEGMRRAAETMSDQGFPGVHSQPGERVTFNPQSLRSRFARFDPRLSHLANLNAANIDPLTGAAAMGASQQQQDPLASLRAYLAQNGLLSQ